MLMKDIPSKTNTIINGGRAKMSYNWRCLPNLFLDTTNNVNFDLLGVAHVLGQVNLDIVLGKLEVARIEGDLEGIYFHVDLGTSCADSCANWNMLGVNLVRLNGFISTRRRLRLCSCHVDWELWLVDC
jgi:hypothetical protein